MMEVLGFKVCAASDGAEAVRVLREKREDTDLVMLDPAMPHMNGEEAFHAMKAMDPGLNGRRTDWRRMKWRKPSECF